MTHRRCCRLLPLMVLAVLPWVGPGFAEVSVDESGGKITGLAFMQVTGGGGGEPLPWPLVRQHVPADWVLNPGGSDRVPPDGEPSLGWDPVGDRPEVAWARHDGEDFEIVIASWLGDRWSEPRSVTENAVDDFAPSLAYGPDGTARIAFEREGRVCVVRRPPGGDWSAPEEVDQGSTPTVAATAVERVAYQQAGEDSTEVVVSRRDAGGGWVPEVVATTTFEGLDGDGNVDVRLGGQRGVPGLVGAAGWRGVVGPAVRVAVRSRRRGSGAAADRTAGDEALTSLVRGPGYPGSRIRDGGRAFRGRSRRVSFGCPSEGCVLHTRGGDPMIGTWKKWMMSGSVLLVVATLACGPVVPAFAGDDLVPGQATVGATWPTFDPLVGGDDQVCGDAEQCPGGWCRWEGKGACEVCCGEDQTAHCSSVGCSCKENSGIISGALGGIRKLIQKLLGGGN